MEHNIVGLLRFWKIITDLEQSDKRHKILRFFGAPDEFVKDSNCSFLQLYTGQILELNGKKATCILVEKDGKTSKVILQAAQLLKEKIGVNDYFAYIIVRRGLDIRTLYKKLEAKAEKS